MNGQNKRNWMKLPYLAFQKINSSSGTLNKESNHCEFLISTRNLFTDFNAVGAKQCFAISTEIDSSKVKIEASILWLSSAVSNGWCLHKRSRLYNESNWWVGRAERHLQDTRFCSAEFASSAAQSQKKDECREYATSWPRWHTRAHIVQHPLSATRLQV